MKYLLTTILISWTYLSYASECYHYHTTTTHEIKSEQGKVYWITTVKDPNGISIASYSKKELKGITTDNVRMLAEDANGIIIADAIAYYWLDKNPYTFEDRGLGKIIDVKNVTHVFDAHTFCINGEWKHLDYDIYANKSTWKNITGFPRKAELMKHFTEGRGDCYLLKDDVKVYSYDAGEGICTVIPGLDAATTNFAQTDWVYGEHFLYDRNTFYLTNVNFDNFEDITSQFNDMELKKQFTDARFLRNGSNLFLDFGNGSLWAYVKAGISLQNGGNIYFYPVAGAIWLENCNLVKYKDQFYEDGWNLVYEQGNIDLTEVAHLEKLRISSTGFYTDDEYQYQLNYVDEGRKMERLPVAAASLLLAEWQQYNGVNSYHYGTSPFMTDGNRIIYWNYNSNKEYRSIPYQSEIRDLGLAFAFDDKLLIEDSLIIHHADRESLELIGSTVDVISACDGGEGQYPVEVLYNYFFKDSTTVYKYHSGDKALMKIPGIAPGSIHKNGYEQMITLSKN